MERNTIAVVTGANRGIGLGICETLISSTEHQPITLYACSRQGLDLNLSPSDPDTKIRYTTLDISLQESISKLAAEVKSELERQDPNLGGGRVILINNAAAVIFPHNAQNVKMALDVNYRGTLKALNEEMCLAFIPLLGPKGRIVNVSASNLPLDMYNPENQVILRGPGNNLPALEELANKYEQAVANDNEEEAGFGNKKNAYFIGKACINSFTAILARENEGLVINACCPGWVDTRLGKMGMGTPPKTREDGARIPIRLGFGGLGDVTGRFWANETIVDTGDGEVKEW